MVIKHNLTAMNANRMQSVTSRIQSKTTEKLSSGYRINRGADDAAGLAISEKMRRQVRGLIQASANAQDGISCVQTAEGALNEIHDMLQRINELSVKAANGTITDDDRGHINSEVQQIAEEIKRVSDTATFNEQSLLDGSFKNKGIQVDAESGRTIEININRTPFFNVRDDTLSVMNANSMNEKTKEFLKVISEQRAELGSIQNRLEHTVNNLDNVTENTQSAETAIRDTDMAKEMVRYANGNILSYAGWAILAQANQSNQSVLGILR